MTIPAPAFQLPAHVQPAVPPTPAPAPTPTVEAPVLPMGFMAEKYRALRDKRDAIEARHVEELKPIKDVMKQLEGLMQKQLIDAGATSTRTEHGTVINSTRTSYTVEDADALNQWCEANHAHHLKETRISKDAIEEYLKAGNPMPPGVKVSAISTLQVRKN